MTARADHERAEFEKWLGIKPCGAAHDFGWAAWQARAALSTTKIKGDSLEQFNENKGLWVVMPEPAGFVSKRSEGAVFDKTLGLGTYLYSEQQVRALLATGGQAQAEHGGE